MAFRKFAVLAAAAILTSGATAAQAEEVWLECDIRVVDGHKGTSLYLLDPDESRWQIWSRSKARFLRDECNPLRSTERIDCQFADGEFVLARSWTSFRGSAHIQTTRVNRYNGALSFTATDDGRVNERKTGSCRSIADPRPQQRAF